MDFVVLGVTTESGTYDPSNCLLPLSHHNPTRKLLHTCVLNSNHQGVTRFILLDGEDKCFDQVETVMLIKAAFLARRRAARTRTSRSSRRRSPSAG